MKGLSEREKLLEIMYMVVCKLLQSVDKNEVNTHLFQLSKIRDAIDAEDATIPEHS